MVKCIIQVSDVHIRNFMRHEEYGTQLEEFINKCQEIVNQYDDPSEVRILVCGDIVHSKNTISNELMVFASTFLRSLSKIAQVLVYAGNHDLIVNNNSRTDTITALFETAQFDNVIFLDNALNYQSGCLIDENITWVLYSIYDGYKKPEIETVDGNTVIGLYHGTIVGAQLANGFIIENGKDGDTFEGCDYVMAGDIHKYQEIKRGEVEIVYSGSLIQQTFGETITQHGFVVWDIENKSHNFVELPTEYGLYDFEISSMEDIDNDVEILKNL